MHVTASVLSSDLDRKWTLACQDSGAFSCTSLMFQPFVAATEVLASCSPDHKGPLLGQSRSVPLVLSEDVQACDVQTGSTR